MRKGSFSATFREYDYTMTLIERSYWWVADASDLPVVFKRELVKGLALRMGAAWQQLVTLLLTDLLNRDTSKFAEWSGFRVRKHLSWDECRGLLLGTEDLRAQRVDEVKRLAKNVLAQHLNSFAAVAPADSKVINEFLQLRNLLAHQSPKAFRSLALIYRAHGISSHIDPGRFLLNNHRLMRHYAQGFWRAEESMRIRLGMQPRVPVPDGRDAFNF